MHEDEDPEFNIGETIRSIAREFGDSINRMLEQADVDQPAQNFGIDPDRAREWAETAGNWLRSSLEHAGEELADRFGAEQEQRHQPPAPDPRARETETDTGDPLRGAAPSPLDVPTSEQGLALAAIDSGRWTVEPGTETLASHGDGPGPSDALGLVRELRVRDWITADGQLTLAGRRALGRWLEVSP